MKILKYLGLRKKIIINLDIEKLDFYKEFSKSVIDTDSEYSERKHTKNAKYSGVVKFDTFKIRRLNSTSNSEYQHPNIIGEITEIDKGKIRIDVEISVSSLGFVFGLMVSSFIVISLLQKLQYLTDIVAIRFLRIGILFIIISGLYRYFRDLRSIRREKSDIFKEINYIVNNFNYIKKEKGYNNV